MLAFPSFFFLQGVGILLYLFVYSLTVVALQFENDDVTSFFL